MYHMIERGVRGGYAGVIQRYAHANNPYMQSYNPQIENSFLLYLDQNSLYAYVMEHCNLPTHGFKWLSAKEMLKLNPCTIPDDADVGYILEVSLRYPKRFHDVRAHKDFPLACDKMLIRGRSWQIRGSE